MRNSSNEDHGSPFGQYDRVMVKWVAEKYPELFKLWMTLRQKNFVHRLGEEEAIQRDFLLTFVLRAFVFQHQKWCLKGGPRGGMDERKQNFLAQVTGEMIFETLKYASAQWAHSRVFNEYSSVHNLALFAYGHVIHELMKMRSFPQCRNVMGFVYTLAQRGLSKENRGLPSESTLEPADGAWVDDGAALEAKEHVARVHAYWEATLPRIKLLVIKDWSVQLQQNGQVSYDDMKRRLPELAHLPNKRLTSWVFRILEKTRNNFSG